MSASLAPFQRCGVHRRLAQVDLHEVDLLGVHAKHVLRVERVAAELEAAASGSAAPVFQSMSARRPSSVQKPKSGDPDRRALEVEHLLQCSIDQCSEAVCGSRRAAGSRKKLRRHEVTLRLRACHTSGLSQRVLVLESASRLGLSR